MPTKKITETEEKIQALERDLLKFTKISKEHERLNRIYYFKPYAWMNRVLDLIRANTNTVVCGPNKIGKTALNACILDSWARGHELWNEVTVDTPGAVRVVVRDRDHWYNKSTLGIEPPVKLRLSGEDWSKHFGETVIPELKKWLPMADYQTKKNTQGFDYKFMHKETGSTIELITYMQHRIDPSTSESWFGHGWIPDEPPPRTMYGGMSRGMFLVGGKMYMPTTPLKEAWILDELVLKPSRSLGLINDLTILANDQLYTDDYKTLEGLGLDADQIATFFDLMLFKDKSKRIFVEDQGKKAEDYLEQKVLSGNYDSIPRLKLLRFVKETNVEEAATRFGGQFRALAGIILKAFDPATHWIEPFAVPTDWPVVAMIDIAMSKPQAISYHAVNKQDVRFIIKERYEHLSADEIADCLIRDKSANAWRLKNVYIDPLAKGDSAYMRNQIGSHVEDSFTIIDRKIRKHGMRLIVGSKDKESGVKNIISALRGPNNMATYYIFNTCPRHYTEIMRWAYDKHGNFPKGSKDDFDDMIENWYRATLTGLRYTPMRGTSDFQVSGESSPVQRLFQKSGG